MITRCWPLLLAGLVVLLAAPLRIRGEKACAAGEGTCSSSASAGAAQHAGSDAGDEQLTVVFDLHLYGELVVQTVPRGAMPRATSNFLEHVRRGFYDGCVIYRAQSTIVQGGECAGWPQLDVPPHAFTASHHASPLPGVVPHEYNPLYPNRYGSVSLAGSPAKEHFFVNMDDRNIRDFGPERTGTPPDPVIGHMTAASMRLLHAVLVQDTQQLHPSLNIEVTGMQFLQQPLRIMRAFVLEDEQRAETQTFLATIGTDLGDILIRTVHNPQVRPSVSYFLENCRVHYAGCVFHRAQNELVQAGECHDRAPAPYAERPEQQETYSDRFVAGSVALTSQRHFFINMQDNSDWIEDRTVIGHVVRGWGVVQRMLKLPTQQKHPTIDFEKEGMMFLSSPVTIRSCTVAPWVAPAKLLRISEEMRAPVPVPPPMPASKSWLWTDAPMQYARLGRTGLWASLVSVGTHMVGPGARLTTPADTKSYMQVALALGVNVFDTAEIYPCTARGCTGRDSERLLGPALKAALRSRGKSREDIIIVDKIYDDSSGGLNSVGLSRKRIVRGCVAALRRLDTDYIDVLLAHADDVNAPMEEVVRAFSHLVRRGLILHWGVSNFRPERVREAIAVAERLGLTPPSIAQDAASIYGPASAFPDMMSIVRDNKIGVMLFESRNMGGAGWEENYRRAAEVAEKVGTGPRTVMAAGAVVAAQAQDMPGTTVITAGSTIRQLIANTVDVMRLVSSAESEPTMRAYAHRLRAPPPPLAVEGGK